MPITPFGWQNSPSTATPLSAAELESFAQFIAAYFESGESTFGTPGTANSVALLNSSGQIPGNQITPSIFANATVTHSASGGGTLSNGEVLITNTNGSSVTWTLPAAAAGLSVIVIRENLNTANDSVIIQTPDSTLINNSLTKISLGDRWEIVQLLCYSTGASFMWTTNEPAAGRHNIRRYGAVGDNGNSDDTTAITNAIALGGITFIPAGRYGVQQVEMVGMTYLLGVGYIGVQTGDLNASPYTDSVLVPYSGQASAAAMIHGSIDVAYVVLDNLALIGNAAYTVGGGANINGANQYSAAIWLDDNPNTAEHAAWNISRVMIQGFTGHGIYVGFQREAVRIFYQTEICYNGGYGVVFRGSDCIFDSANSSYNNLGGIWMSGAHSTVQGASNIFQNVQMFNPSSTAYVNPSFAGSAGTSAGVGIGFQISSATAGGIVTTSVAHGFPIGWAMEAIMYAPGGITGTGLTFSSEIAVIDANTNYVGATVLTANTLQLTTAVAAGGQSGSNINFTGALNAGTLNLVPITGAVTIGAVGSCFLCGGNSIDRNWGHGCVISYGATAVNLHQTLFISNGAGAAGSCNHVTTYSANLPAFSSLGFLLAVGGFSNKPEWCIGSFGSSPRWFDAANHYIAFTGVASGNFTNTESNRRGWALQPSATAATGAAVAAMGFPGQTADILQVMNSSGTELYGISSTGIPVWKNSNGQTTVGSAGSATALPANPSRYLKVTGDDGNSYVVPVYKVS